MAGAGAEAGMKGGRNRLRPTDRAVTRQVDIAPQHPGARGAAGCGVEMDHLFLRMDPRVGASRTLQAHWMVSHPTQRRLQGLLDGAHPRLGLPTAKCAAVILQAQGDPLSGHGEPGGGVIGHAQATRRNNSRAAARCSSLPSPTTSSKMPFAASWSPISI